MSYFSEYTLKLKMNVIGQFEQLILLLFYVSGV
jgi:hypothetical protein